MGLAKPGWCQARVPVPTCWHHTSPRVTQLGGQRVPPNPPRSPPRQAQRAGDGSSVTAESASTAKSLKTAGRSKEHPKAMEGCDQGTPLPPWASVSPPVEGITPCPFFPKAQLKNPHLLKTPTETSSRCSPATQSTCKRLKYFLPALPHCAAPGVSRATSPQPAKPHQQAQTADPGEKQPAVERGAGGRPLTSSWIQSLRLHCGAAPALPLPGKRSKHS